MRVLLFAAVWVAAAAAEPTMVVTDGSLRLHVDADKQVQVQVGETAPKSILLHEDAEPRFQSIENAVSMAASEDQAADLDRNTLHRSLDNLSTMTQEELSRHTSQLVNHSEELHGQALSSELNSKLLGDHSEQLARAQRDVSCAAADRNAISEAILNAFATVENSTAARLAAAEARAVALEAQLAACNARPCNTPGVVVSSSDTATVVAVNASGCRGAPCAAGEEVDIIVYVRGSVFFDSVDGLYTCEFIDVARNTVRTTPAVVSFHTSSDTKLYRFGCKTPRYLTKELTQATFSTFVRLKEGAHALYYPGEDPGPAVDFEVVGPVITAPSAVELVWYDASQAGPVYSIPIGISDKDVDPDSLETTSSATGSLAASFRLAKVGSGRWEVQYTLGSTAPSEEQEVQFTVVSKDTALGLSDTKTITIAVVPFANVLAFTLDTTDGSTRWNGDTNFWTSNTWTVNAERNSSNFLIGGDVKTAAYFSVHMGERVKIVASIGTSVIGTSFYDVAASFRAKTVYDLMVGTANAVFAVKDQGASTAGTPIRDRLVDANGNEGQERGDPFLDFSDSLMANINAWGCAQRNLIRLGTDRRVGSRYGPTAGNCGGHTYFGFGGDHYHGDWCIRYEASPIIGYCDTHNFYGSNNFGGCAGHYPLSNCGGSKRQTNVKFSFFLHAK